MRSLAAASFTLILAACSSSKSEPDKLSHTLDCGFTIVEPPAGVPGDPCAGGVTVFGPTAFHRQPGGGHTFATSFSAPNAEIFCVRVENPDGIATASVSIDDTEVLGASEFAPDTPVSQAYADLAFGTHDLEVDISGPVNRDLIVKVTASLDPTVPRPAGSSTLVSLANLYDHSDPLTPNGDGYSDTIQIGFDAVVGELPACASDNFDFSYHYTVTIRATDTCFVVRNLSGDEPVVGGSQTIATTWDGVNAAGGLVADGDYVYSVTVDLVRSHNGHSTVLDSVTSHIQKITVDGDPGCVVAADCDDGTPCTDDSCHLGTCINQTNDAPCGPAGEPWVPDQLIVLFSADRTEAQRLGAVSAAGGTIVTRIDQLRLYLIGFAPGTDLDAAAASLTASGDVIMALKNFIGENQTEPDDPLYATDQWNLDSTPGGAEPDTDTADIDMPEAWSIDTDASNAIIAIVDEGVEFQHPDMAGRFWANDDECCITPPCSPVCNLLAPCPLNEQEAAPDGCPGGCGADDDTDGLADFNDPQVRNLMSNGRDDDGDGCKDEGGPGATDNDGDGCKDEDPVDTLDNDGDGLTDEDPINGLDCLASGGPFPLTVETEDCDGVAADDDENGYIDDCKGYDFTGFDNNPSNASPTHHGVRVTGVAAANGDNATGISGVAWNAKVMGLRRGADMFSTLEAYAYAANNGAHIINASHEFVVAAMTKSQVTELYRALHARQSLLVVAAGNDGANLDLAGTVLFPQHVDLPHVVVVTDTDISNGLIATANTGLTTVDFAAPGDAIMTTIAGASAGTSCITAIAATGYDCAMGTSLAAPHVSGLAADIIGHFPEMSGDSPRIAQTLRNNAEAVPALAGVTVTGGRVAGCKSLGGCGGAPATPAYFVERTREQLPGAFIDVPTYEVDMFDADGDGDKDMLSIMCSHQGDLTQPLLFINSGTFTGVFVNETFRLPAAPRNQCGADEADVNGDGFMDIMATGFGVFNPAETQDRLYLNSGTGTFTDVTAAQMPTDTLVSRDVDFCDLNNDLAPDMLISGDNIAVYINDGTGTFTDATATWITGALVIDSHNASCTDLTGDGLPDAFITGGQNGQNLLFINVAGTSFSDQTVARGIPVSTSQYTHDADVADFTGDGQKDIVLAMRGNQQSRFLRNTGAGNFVDETAAAAGCGGGPRLPAILATSTEVDAADVDGDGDRDLLFLNGDPNVGLSEQSRLYINNGSGCFSDQSVVAGIPQANIEVSTDSAFADIDNDGDCDVVVSNWGAPHYLLANTANVAFPSGCMTP